MRRLALALLIGVPAAAGAFAASGPDAERGKVTALAFDAADGALLEATDKGLYRSTDEGRSWQPVALPASARGHVAALAVSKKGAFYIGGPGIGVLSSTDGGGKWTARNKGVPSRDVVAVAAHADQPDTVYVYVAKRGIFRSEDRGSHWKLMDAGPREPIRSLVHSNMPGSMQTGWFFAATAKGVGRSMDCFCGWRDAGALGHPAAALTYDPKQPQRVYAATGEGLYVSADGGEKWERASSPAPDITALAAASSGALYAVTAGGILFRSADGARSWAPVDG